MLKKLLLVAFFSIILAGSLWQLEVTVNSLLNQWDYAFPFQIIVFPYFSDIWIARDWLTASNILSAVVLLGWASS